jgi:hypothetical protein
MKLDENLNNVKLVRKNAKLTKEGQIKAAKAKEKRDIALEELKKDTAKVLSLKMHERCWVKNISKDVCRVQSGWLYSDWDVEKDLPYNTVFVIDNRI